MLKLSQKIEKLTTKRKVKEFINVVKKARQDIEEGKTTDYLEFRKTLSL